MSDLAFLSPSLASAVDGVSPRYRSPLEHALAGAGDALRDLSTLGKLEVRRELDAALEAGAPEVVRIAPNRTLVLCEAEAAPALAAQLGAVDVSAALAGLALSGERLMRRLTDLDLDGLPAMGAVAGIQCTVLRDEDEFRLFFAQEYGDHVAAVVLDAMAGLR
ncbi:MAG: hypothetical protein MSC30_07635 [Gaiellaceae bacterium MAG52_C11]|nr:hypothetical protein [Candidatus Gaiellasilicea maunaloa]